MALHVTVPPIEDPGFPIELWGLTHHEAPLSSIILQLTNKRVANVPLIPGAPDALGAGHHGKPSLSHRRSPAK
jgi:hypothetical protein